MVELVVDGVPNILRDEVTRRWEEFQQRIGELSLSVPKCNYVSELSRVWASSWFVSQNFLRYPAVFIDMLQSGDLDREISLAEYRQRCATLDSITDDTEFMAQLRQLRHREMTRIAWRDNTKKADVEVSLRELSEFAIAAIDYCSRRAYRSLFPVFGAPVDNQGKSVDLIILGMGKLGASELNYSSDVDLIFAYRDEGDTTGGERTISNYEFFVKQAQRLVQWLNESTVDGFVFRVDTRLRPFGSAGQLALSFDAMETYYETHGRDWERYALVKANVISGNESDGATLLKRLRPFVYRRYLDFNAFAALREMKRMIMAEVNRKGMADNVKLGAGGIREIEFIGQAFQLIRGGQEKSLQERKIILVLQTIARLNLLPDFAIEKLIAAYRFLRLTENRIQAIGDQQTHLLPSSEIDRARLSLAMGYADWNSFKRHLDEHRNFVQAQFHQVFSAPQAETKEASGSRQQDDFLALWLGRLSENDAAVVMQQAGFADGAAASQSLLKLAESSACRKLSPRGRERIDRLIPLLLGAVGANPQADVCLPRVLQLIEAVAKRTVYLALLVEHPMAMSQLVQLCAKSAWIADLLTRYPLLLDELLDPRRLYEPMYKTQLAAELENRLTVVEVDDTEGLMNVLRQFKLANTLRVAASQLTEAMPLAKVSDHLTFVAEVVLQKVVDIAWAELVKRHGIPRYSVNGETHTAGFSIIAYGKLAGWELGFGSDLDIVFIHNSRGDHQQTDGEKSLDNSVFFARLGQRVMHFLSTPTTNGVLYDIDTRLRPSGRSGLLVSSLESFIEYQRAKAWTWEHQALVRARAVAGDEQVLNEFNHIRREVLSARRDESTLQKDVVEMRMRMRKELDRSKNNVFDLKQGEGGIIDIEFINQYLVLRWAAEFPELTTWADNLRIIEIAAKTNRLSEENAKLLSQAFLSYRHRVHELSLDQQTDPLVDNTEFCDQRAAVTRIWREIFSSF